MSYFLLPHFSSSTHHTFFLCLSLYPLLSSSSTPHTFSLCLTFYNLFFLLNPSYFLSKSSFLSPHFSSSTPFTFFLCLTSYHLNFPSPPLILSLFVLLSITSFFLLHPSYFLSLSSFLSPQFYSSTTHTFSLCLPFYHLNFTPPPPHTFPLCLAFFLLSFLIFFQPSLSLSPCPLFPRHFLFLLSDFSFQSLLSLSFSHFSHFSISFV